jgi:hypothetical protein
MSTWKIACGTAMLSLLLAPAARADEFTKLTLLTFSGPVDLPGISLPAGTYRFSLADPETGRRVVKVTSKDGTKTYGMFLSMSNERVTPTRQPVILFKEAAAGAPPAVKVWFYPGESYGYEFAYPHDQAVKIARATHEPVLSYTERATPSSATDESRVASMRGAEVARIDENGKPVSSDERLKDSSTARAPARAASSSRNEAPVATTGSATAAPAQVTRLARKELPRTGSELPMMALLASLSLAGGFGLRLVRKTL